MFTASLFSPPPKKQQISPDDRAKWMQKASIFPTLSIKEGTQLLHDLPKELRREFMCAASKALKNRQDQRCIAAPQPAM